MDANLQNSQTNKDVARGIKDSKEEGLIPSHIKSISISGMYAFPVVLTCQFGIPARRAPWNIAEKDTKKGLIRTTTNSTWRQGTSQE